MSFGRRVYFRLHSQLSPWLGPALPVLHVDDSLCRWGAATRTNARRAGFEAGVHQLVQDGIADAGHVGIVDSVLRPRVATDDVEQASAPRRVDHRRRDVRLFPIFDSVNG